MAGTMLHGMDKEIRIILMSMDTMQQIAGIHMIMERMHTRDMTGHILRLMVREQKVNGYGSMDHGTILMLVGKW